MAAEQINDVLSILLLNILLFARNRVREFEKLPVECHDPVMSVLLVLRGEKYRVSFPHSVEEKLAALKV